MTLPSEEPLKHTSDRTDIWDVIIVGAGPAGLSAALILGRCCRRVLVVDRATPRSWASHAMHGYLSRDGIDPQLFRDQARQELARYQSVEFRWDEAVRASRVNEATFLVQLATGERVAAKKLLLATGVSDELPDIAGVEEFFGKSVFPCPYCDGWELRGAPIAVYGRGRRGFHMSRALTAWTRAITLCTDGPAQLSRSQRQALEANGIKIESEPISMLRGTAGMLEGILFSSGRSVACRAMFFDLPCHAQCRQGSLDLLAGGLEPRRQLEVAAELEQRLVDVEPRLVGRDLEQHAAGLTEVDRCEVPAVDDRSDL